MMAVLDNRWVRVALLFGICIVILSIITPGAHAEPTYEIHQGEIVYQDDYADLALVASWPDFQLAWCSSDEPGCFNPYVVDLEYENQHKVLIDKKRFYVGNYYRWDGGWNRGENSFAMRVLPGPRPVNETIVTIGNKTIPKSEITSPAKILPNTTHIVLARGDDITYHYAIPNETKGNVAAMWMFQTDISATNRGVLGSLMEYRSNDSVYSWDINTSMSESLTEGNYAGYIQYSGGNNRQDVFYTPQHKTDKCNIDYADVLDTLYDDDIIPDINIEGLTPALIKDRFESLSMNEYSDDELIPLTMKVESPLMMFTDYSHEGNNISVSGKTSMSAGTIVIFKLDPQQYVMDYDVKAHTWSTETVGGIDSWRTFNITIPVNWDEMAVGANHTVVASVNKNRISISTSKDFKVSDVFIMPTPTPQREKVILEDYGWHRVTPTIAQETTPDPIKTEIVVESTQLSNETPIIQQNVTVNQTTPLKTQTPVPRDTNVHVPLPAWIGVVAVAGAIMLRK